MTLTKKHIGKLFDNHGADGSWAYQLVDVQKDKLLFLVTGVNRFEIDSNKYKDWRPFVPIRPSFSEIQKAWQTARVAV